MKRIYSHIIYTCLTIILLAGCKSDYPYIEYEGNPGKVEFDNIESLIPIMTTMNSPLYENHTRGTGIFNNEKDKDFYIYAFYTPKGKDGVPQSIDYSMNPQEEFHCLVDDPTGHGLKARLSEISSALEWVKDTMVYYNNTYPDYRYRFFAYHVDDSVDMEKMQPNRHHDYVSYDIQIDGTQDLMCSCAQPTPEQLAKIKSLASPSNKDFINNLEKLTYSTQSAHRDLLPLFETKHQLAYIQFFLKADSTTFINSSGDQEKRVDSGVDSVLVENISIKNVPYKGKFIVAAEDTSRLGIDYDNEKTDIYLPVKVKTDSTGQIIKDSVGRITVSRDEEGKVMAGDPVGLNPRLKPKVEEQDLGMGFLLPEAERYYVLLKCKQLKTDKNGDLKTLNYSQQFELVLPRDKNGNTCKFLSGHKYAVTIRIYGIRDIRLELEDLAWLDGGEIIIDDEN